MVQNSKKIIKAGQVHVNGMPVKNADRKIEETAEVTCQGQAVSYQKYTDM